MIATGVALAVVGAATGLPLLLIVGLLLMSLRFLEMIRHRYW